MGVRRATALSAQQNISQKASKADQGSEIDFHVGDKVVYPGHGVGQVRAVETKHIAGNPTSFYMIRILANDVTVMVPLNMAKKKGLRSLVGEKEVKKLYRLFKNKELVVELTTWNRRQREYMEKINTGSVFEIGEVLRDLYVIKKDKVLSFGERKMLELAKGLLVRELSLAESTDETTVEAQIEEAFA